MNILRAFGAVIFFLLALSVVIDGCSGNGGYNKEAEDAYQRLRDQGFTTKQIYEMGKDQ